MNHVEVYLAVLRASAFIRSNYNYALFSANCECTGPSHNDLQVGELFLHARLDGITASSFDASKLASFLKNVVQGNDFIKC